MLKADKLPSSCAVVMKSVNLNFLEPSGPLQACNGTDLPVPSTVRVKVEQSHYRPQWSSVFQEVKVPRFRDNGTGRW